MKLFYRLLIFLVIETFRYSRGLSFLSGDQDYIGGKGGFFSVGGLRVLVMKS